MIIPSRINLYAAVAKNIQQEGLSDRHFTDWCSEFTAILYDFLLEQHNSSDTLALAVSKTIITNKRFKLLTTNGELNFIYSPWDGTIRKG